MSRLLECSLLLAWFLTALTTAAGLLLIGKWCISARNSRGWKSGYGATRRSKLRGQDALWLEQRSVSALVVLSSGTTLTK